MDSHAEDDAMMDDLRDAYELLYRRSVWHRFKLLREAGVTTTITLFEEPAIDAYGAVTVGEWKGYLIQIIPMLYNDRVVMSPKRSPQVYDFGWCFDKGPAAYLAVAAWDPETQAEPAGYKKAVIAGREAGQDVAGDDLTPGELQSLALFIGMAAVTDSVP